MISSAEYLKKWCPLGTQTRSKRDLFPNIPCVTGGQWAQVWDETGATYTDWISGLCAIGLGIGYPEVDHAVIRQIRDHGVTFPIPNRLEAEVAEQLCEAIGFGEQVRWVKTGSEATMGAMMIARAFTRNPIILSIGYHGWTSSHQKSDTLIDIKWGVLDPLEQYLRDGGVAAVLLEPMRDYAPPDGYFEGIQELCGRYGALFIIDEIVTGFRWAIGGATQKYGLRPDLVCFGKAMANGYALGAIVGPQWAMHFADCVSSTFGGECVGLAAAQATIGVYTSKPVIAHIDMIGQYLIDHSPVKLSGFPQRPWFSDSPAAEWQQRNHVAVERTRELATRGHLVHPSGIVPTYSHTLEQAKELCKALAG